MTDGATWLGQARELHAQSRWAEACELFSRAERAGQLDVVDLERYAEAAQILGRGDELSGCFGKRSRSASMLVRWTERSYLPSGYGRP